MVLCIAMTKKPQEIHTFGAKIQIMREKYHKVEYVQRRVCFVNVQSALYENVVFLFVRMGNAAYIIFIMWNSISGLEAWYHFRFPVVVWLSQ